MQLHYLILFPLLAQATGSWIGGDQLFGKRAAKLIGNSFGRPGYNETYDYIIVGGGNAGNVVAARLAQDPANFSVAVIEAGGFYETLDGNRTQIPGMVYVNNVDFPLESATTGTSIGLKTVPQRGYNNRQIRTVSAQTLGGNTAANNMAYHRATIGTFDIWAKDVADDFWSWENVYPAYQKSCNFTPPDYSKIDPSVDITWDDSAFAKDGGPLHVSYGNYWGPDGVGLNAGMEQAGLKQIDGLNSGRLIGYSALTANLNPYTAIRDTSETSFLRMAMRETDIKVYPNALAKRVTFDDSKRATGVEVQANIANIDLKWHLSARKEVILSAGAWHSPQLLMVSGIGPKETLELHDIPLIADVPGVGQNEWDQPVVSTIYKVNATTGTQFQAGNLEVVARETEDYINHQSGLLSGFGAGLATGWEKFPASLRSQFSNTTIAHLSEFPEDWPEAEYLVLEYANQDVVEASLERTIESDENFITFAAVLLSTASRGNMTISSADTMDQPVIDPAWLTDSGDGDLEQSYAAFMRLREIMANSSVAEAEVFPGPDVQAHDDVVAWLRDNMGHIYHAVSTCKMGAANDSSAVLDSRARVRGVTGLRVVDASSLPLSPPGHPVASIYMLAEKIAESILSGN
ncbi:hypothetical protein J7T55_011002 [Diaporthe amygdali]|uniref:uncharacterized protein n=1 Tax=Phomopsis amygdali TaxID=1214568 RepID=UPI0022FE18E5|nr:uncharacterized protein J7T55_011002 [Diaporthe amygdali]KAJ0103985.1 hypothetical protein J7T55_011002 [Diaporthe amygdali]